MAKLYTLKTGKMSRKSINKPVKDADGNILGYEDERFFAPHDFVPTPGELKANGFRMVFVKDVPDDSPEAREALLNQSGDVATDTSKNIHTAHPTANQLPTTKQPVKQVEVRNMDNITKFETVDALKVIEETTDNNLLAEYSKQEAGNKPRVRKVIIRSIADRMEAINETKRVGHTDDPTTIDPEDFPE